MHMIPALRALRPLSSNRYCLIHWQDTISSIKERMESTPPEPQVHMNGCKLPADLKAKVAQGKASKQERIAYKYAPIECCTIEGKWCRRKGSDQRVANGYAPLACRVLEGKRAHKGQNARQHAPIARRTLEGKNCHSMSCMTPVSLRDKHDSLIAICV